MTRNSRVLVVDDDRDFRNMVRLALDNGKRDIVEAATALDGLHRASETPPDILLLDIGLPGHYNGFSLCESLCKDPRHHKLQVVVVSGHGEEEDIEQAKRLGVVAYVVKPFSQSTLVDLVGKLERQISDMVTIVS